MNKKDLTNHVCALASSTEAEVMILNECAVPITSTLDALKKNVDRNFLVPYSTPKSQERFHCFSRSPGLDFSEIHKGIRTSFRKLRLGSRTYLFGLVHSIDIRNYGDGNRQAMAQKIASEVKFVKTQQKISRIILMGDFNMNPFDTGMNLAEGLNAMMTRDCISAASRKYLGEYYDFYYNPMWKFFGDEVSGPSGTIYDTSNVGPYGWNMFDQVLLNYSAISEYRGVEILTTAGNSSLANSRGRPDKRSSSDHFPIALQMGGYEID